MDQFPDAATIRTKWNELEVNLRRFVDRLGEEGIGRTFEYTMLSGEPRASLEHGHRTPGGRPGARVAGGWR